MKPARRLGSLAAVVAMLVACGSESSEGGGASSGAEGSSGASGGLFGGDGDGGTGGPGSSGGNGGNCFAPVDMFIMFDRSGSMARNSGNGEGDPDLDCNIGEEVPSKWCRAINALSGYFKSESSKDHAAALQFFPLNGHQNAHCKSGQGYMTAAKPQTGFLTLPTDAFDQDLNAATPDTRNNTPGTPTEAAINGLINFTSANRRGGRVTIGVLITDGNPTNINGSNCDTNLNHLSGLLEKHHQETQVRTYVIGMEGASQNNLEALASKGGGPQHPNNVPGATNVCGGKETCTYWNVGAGDPAVFTAVLKAIQESADGCKEGGGFVNPVN